MIKHKTILFAALIGTLQGCATLSKSECREADWKIIGLEDGAAGRPVSYIGRHRKSCAEYGVKPNKNHYQLGHAEGVRTFCTPRKGYQLGSSGRGHNDVCPAELRGAFLAAYDDGREVHAAQKAMQDAQNRARALGAEIQGIASEIAGFEKKLVSGSGTAEERQTWINRVKSLQAMQTQKQSELHDLEHEAAELQGEYEYLSSLFNY